MNTNEIALRPEKEGPGGLVDAIAMILDKGLVINADITVSVVGVELLGVKIRAALASFETAAKYGLEFPSGTNLNARLGGLLWPRNTVPTAGSCSKTCFKRMNACCVAGKNKSKRAGCEEKS